MKLAVAVCLFAIISVLAANALPRNNHKKFSSKVGVPVGTCTTPGEYLPDSSDCAAFYECDEDLNPDAFSCDPGLCWNEDKEECEFTNTDYCMGKCY